jgi:ribosomal protein S18 acetylase RimI-like enzyme
MSTILYDLSPAAIIPAIEANLATSWRLFGQLPGAMLYDTPDLLWVSTNIPYPPFNGVVRTSLAAETVDTTIATVLEHFTQRHTSMLWLVTPSAHPSDLDHRLVAAGLVHKGNDPGMAISLETLPHDLPVPPGFTIEQVNDAASLRSWCSFTDQAVLSEALFAWGNTLGFSPDRPLYHYLGRLHDRPIATASLVLGGGVAGLYNVMTVPEAQRQGIGALMTVTALHDARMRGYRLGVLQSSKMGLALYRRLGFQEYCTIGIYILPGDNFGD